MPSLPLSKMPCMTLTCCATSPCPSALVIAFPITTLNRKRIWDVIDGGRWTVKRLNDGRLLSRFYLQSGVTHTNPIITSWSILRIICGLGVAKQVGAGAARRASICFCAAWCKGIKQRWQKRFFMPPYPVGTPCPFYQEKSTQRHVCQPFMAFSFS